MTSMPASRRARATILTPRSWPSSPTLATSTRIGGMALRIVRLGGDLRRRGRAHDAELATALAQRVAVDAEQAGGTELVAAGEPERVQDQRLFEDDQRFAIHAAGMGRDETLDQLGNQTADDARQRAQRVLHDWSPLVEFLAHGLH